MDSLTQIVLGASVAGVVGIKPFGRKVLIAGALLGTLPDLDVLLHYQTAIENLTYHRGFSHSLFVLSLLSLCLYWFILYLKPALSSHKKSLFGVIALPLITHPLLDSFTTYGTQLLWPMTSPPISFSSVFIIDPLYTLPLLVAVLGLWINKDSIRWQRINRAMLVISCLYLVQGKAQHWFIEQKISHDPIVKNHKLLITPTPFNTLKWRVVSYHEQAYYEAFTNVLDTQPLRWERNNTGRDLLHNFNSEELQRLEWFTGGLIQFTEMEGILIATDLRIGIPKVYPFSLTLAKWQEQSYWKSIPSENVLKPKVNWTSFSDFLTAYK